MKRILKYLGRITGTIFLLLLLVVFLIYLPPVQKVVFDKVLDYASSHYGLSLEAERFRLGFPLKLELENVFARKSGADTLLAAQSLMVNIGLKKILRRELSVDGLVLKQARMVVENDTTGMRLDTRIGELSLEARSVNLSKKKVMVDYIRLQGGEVDLLTGSNSEQDTATSKIPDWTFEIDRIDLNQIAYRMGKDSLSFFYTGLKEGRVTEGIVVLGGNAVSVGSVFVSGGWCRMRSGEKVAGDGQASRTPEVPAVPWTIRAGTVRLENSAFQMERQNLPQTHLVLAGIGIQLDSIYNRGSVIKALLKDLKAVQEGGIEVTAMRAAVDLDTAVTALHGMYVQTPYSWLRLEAQADTSLQHLMGKMPLAVSLNARIGMQDILPFYENIPLVIRQKTMGVNASFALSGERIQLGQLILDMPGHFKVTGNGRAASYRQLSGLRGKVDLRAELEDITFMQEYLQREGIHIPRQMNLTASLKADRGDLAARADLKCRQGLLHFSGNYQMKPERYEGEIEWADFQLSSFLPRDSLGEVSARMHLKGTGFSWPQAQAEVIARIDDFSYRGHSYNGIDLQMSLDHTRLRGYLESKDSLAPVELLFRGDSVETAYRMDVMGRIDEVDLEALHLMAEPLKVGMNLHVQAEMAPENAYHLNLSLDSLRMTDRQRNYALGRLELDMQSDREKVGLTLMSGDLNLKFRSDTALMGFIAQVQKTVQLMDELVRKKEVDMNRVKKELPPFNFSLTGGRENAVAGFLKSRNIGFKNIYFDAVSRRRQGVRLGFEAEAPYFGKVRLDSVQLGAWQTGKGLAYHLNARSSAESWKGLFNINLTGRIQENQLRVELKQKNNQGETGFDLGLNLTLLDSAFAVSFFPVNPILGYSRWMVNAGNKIVVGKDLKVNADLRMAYRDKLVGIRSLEPEEDGKERLQMEIRGIQLENLSRMLPFMPQLAGVVNTDLMLYFRENLMGVAGEVGVRDLYYRGQRVGTLDLGLKYAGKNRFTEHAVDFELKIDSVRRAVAKGTFSTSENGSGLEMDVDIPSLPLYVANAFMPSGILKLGGEVNGYLHLRGTLERPLLNGELAFLNGKANVLMLGTTFSMDSVPLKVQDGKVLFRRYRFLAPNGSSLVVNGDMALTPFDRMGMNITVKAADFEAVNVKKNTESLVYGKAYTDIDMQIAGPFSDLSVSGNISLQDRTAIVYTLRNSDPQLAEHSEGLVRFVSFRDTTLNEADDLTNRVETGSFSLRLLIEIGSQVSATVALSEDGSNYVSIQGGGNLVLVTGPESGMTLTGRYILSGGTVVYNVPIAGKKEFSIRNGSYVEWTGNVANPILNISASEAVKATVEDGDRNRLVTFESIIRIQNTLNQPDITFDLSAPNDMVIQNQLNTFSKEERTRQALNLMIYNTYTAPGAAKSQGGNQVANNALYNFVENELNKYTRKVGLTVGMDSYNTDENTVRTDVTYEFSKQFFNDRIRIKIGGRISTDNSDNPSNNGNLQDNLVDDISIEYVFTKKRNLFLKVFRHSNYESVLDGEVTQTGVGVVWRKDFRKFKDLFKNKYRRGQEKADGGMTEDTENEEK